MKSLFILVSLALISLSFSQDCSTFKTCLECTTNFCVACPAINGTAASCRARGSVCEKAITQATECPGALCGNVQCPSDQFCDFSTSLPRCKCRDCKRFDEVKGTCSSEVICSQVPDSICVDNKCGCKTGFRFTPSIDGKSYSCVAVSCGNFSEGCGPNSVCSNQQCVCKDGFIPAPTDPLRPSFHTGCILKPLTCNDTCKGEHKICVGSDPTKLSCVCERGYFLNAAGLCELIPVTSNNVTCSSISTCGVCAGQSSCSWCQGSSSGRCISIAAGSNDVCNDKIASTVGQCECVIKGCADGQVCGPRGCVCKNGTVLYGDKCIDQSNPCAVFTCKTNEVCVNQEVSVGVFRPFCPCKEGYIRNSVGECIEKPSCANATDPRCTCAEVNGVPICCIFPTRFDQQVLKCRLYCSSSNTFVDKEEDCNCPTGLVRDSKLGTCVKPCPDGKPPVEGRCGTICESGQSPNPDKSEGQPACGYTCPDGSFVLNLDACKLACTRIPPPSYCPCELSNQIRLSDGKCITPCADGSLPINGQCITNPCTQGFLIILPDGTRTCGRKCETGELLPFSVPCPLPTCPENQVFDQVLKTCANRCSDGSAPRGGLCPNNCVTSGDCCKPSVDGTNICGPAPCSDGQKRDFLTGLCVTPCSDGTLPPPGRNCSTIIPEEKCPEAGFIKVDGVCGVYCNSTFFSKDPRACCPEGQRFSPFNNLCLCPDGSKPINGICSTTQVCDVINDPKCPCPFPLVRNTTTLKCVCKDEVNYPNPFDGRRCGLNPCPAGLRLSEGGACVCPLTARLPEKIVFEGREITVCKCDPSFVEGCPISPINCEGSDFKACVCLRNASACNSFNAPPTEDKCKLDRSSKECFCRSNPKAPECVLPPLCQVAPNSPECVGSKDCNFENLSLGKCTVDEFCQKNPDAKSCACIKLGECSREGIKISDNKTISDLVLETCSESELKDKKKPHCYCRVVYDPVVCVCVITPSLPQCRNLDSNQTLRPNFTAEEKCKLSPDPLKCIASITKTESEKDVRIKLSESSDNVNDLVDVVVDKKDRAGLIFIERDASKGAKAPEGTQIDASQVKARVGIVVSRCFEFFDHNDNSIFEDGDKLIKFINFFEVKWTINTIQNDEQGITTITFTSEDGSIVVTYVIISKEITVDGVKTTSRTTKLTLDIDFPFDSRSSKLGCVVKVVTKSSVTNGKDSNLSVDGKMNIVFEKTSQSGSTNIDVIQTPAKETTSEDKELVVETGDKVFTVILVPAAFSPGSWHYDPQISLAPVSPSVSIPTSAPTNPPGGDDSSASTLISFSIFSIILVFFAILF